MMMIIIIIILIIIILIILTIIIIIIKHIYSVTFMNDKILFSIFEQYSDKYF